jgi:hypothetical protein
MPEALGAERDGSADRRVFTHGWSGFAHVLLGAFPHVATGHDKAKWQSPRCTTVASESVQRNCHYLFQTVSQGTRHLRSHPRMTLTVTLSSQRDPSSLVPVRNLPSSRIELVDCEQGVRRGSRAGG